MTPVVVKYTEEVSWKEFVLKKIEGIFFLLAREIPFQETGLTIFRDRNKQLFSKPRKDLVLSFTTADGNNQDSFALKLMTFYLNRTVNKLTQRWT